MELFSQRLKYLRTSRKMTQEQLGEKIHVTKVSVSGYENGTRNPDMDTLQRIANFFEVNVDYLLGRSDSPHGGNKTAASDPQDAFKTWVKMRAKKNDFSDEEIVKLEKQVKDILKALDDELFE